MEKHLDATYWKNEYFKTKTLLDNAEQIYTNIGYSNCKKEYENEITELKNKLNNYSEEIKKLMECLSNDVLHSRSVRKVQDVTSCCCTVDECVKKEPTRGFFLYAISMTESERGWGQRPDGTVYTYSLDDANTFISNYINNLPKDHVPDCYTMPSDPEPVELSEDDYEEITSKMIFKYGVKYNWVG